MKPILFSLGPLHLYSFGAMVALGVLLSLFLMNRRLQQSGIKSMPNPYDMVLVVLGSGFAGARLLYIIQNFKDYQSNPLYIFAIWEGGLIFYGGVLGSLLGLYIFLRIRKASFIQGLDFILPYVSLTHAFGRMGCFLNGCCYGKVCDLPWAVTFSDTPYPVHPTQLYEALLDLALFFFLNHRYRHKNFDGETTGFYFMFYAIIRFLVEFWRADNPTWNFFTLNQWFSIFLFAAAFIFYFMKRRNTAD